MATNGTIYTNGVQEDKSHQAISSYFIGPQAENLGFFRSNVSTILDELEHARKNYFPSDGAFISSKTQNSETFQKCTSKIAKAVQKAARLLGSHSLPFWSPRYQAHMCMDLSMPSLLGYFMTTIYNPNNVAIEASPLTTVAEIEVGQQLCELFGYNIDPEKTDVPTGWGHVTCGGTVANLESIWVGQYNPSLVILARNLKFYPLSLRLAMESGKPLSYVADSQFTVETCTGNVKPFMELSTWELLNLRPNIVLDLPDRLYEEYGISSAYLSSVLDEFNIQTTGKDFLEQRFKIDKPSQYMLATTRHYSWPKGAAIAGIGSGNVIGIHVDDGARVDLEKLESALEDSLANEQAVYAVVAIIGSTEEGAVDPLSGILAMRKRFQARGLSFLVHADGAWGGYFCTMLPKGYRPGDVFNVPNQLGADEGFVPDFALRAQTQEDLFALRFADSITVDPHKAGYIPYPAGGLCYRDERLRYLVTWTSPYLSRGAVTSIGIYGVEGSKPGAAAMATWLSNKAIGLHPDGYGPLLNEVTFTCSRFSAEWAAMTTSDMSFTVVPFNMLPSETKPNSTPQAVEAEKQRIRNEILGKSNAEIAAADAHRPESESSFSLLRALGSDLNINAFAINFRYPDGRLNDDVEEANYLMTRVVETLSVDSPGDDPTKVSLFLTSTEFSPDLYGSCAETFKRRLGLKPSNHDLMVLRNVVMNPFPTEGNFIGKLAEEFKRVTAKEVEVCIERNTMTPDFYNFLIQGTEDVFLVHLPKFYVANHRQQIILSVNLDEKIKQQLVDLRNANPQEAFLMCTERKVLMPEILEHCTYFMASVTSSHSGTIMKHVKVEITRVVKSRPLNSTVRDDNYPTLPDTGMSFYLYGNSKSGNFHIDHILTRAPNIQLSSDKVALDIGKDVPADVIENGAILTLDKVSERALQPFAPTPELLNGAGNGKKRKGGHQFFFSAGRAFDVTVYNDPNKAGASGPGLLEVCKNPKNKVAQGKLTLSGRVFVDSNDMNTDPNKTEDQFPKWIAEFDEIGKELE